MSIYRWFHSPSYFEDSEKSGTAEHGDSEGGKYAGIKQNSLYYTTYDDKAIVSVE